MRHRTDNKPTRRTRRGKSLQPYMLVRLKSDVKEAIRIFGKDESGKGYRHWVVLRVSKRDVDSANVNVTASGLHLFGGMWYGDDKTDTDSYGKVGDMTAIEPDDIEIIARDVRELPLDELKKLVG